MGVRVVDLFSGCGGFSLGFQNAGMDVVCAFDNWEPVVKIYEKNFKHKIYKQDLLDVKSTCDIISQQGHIDIIIGGPPCQDYSSAGKRDETKGRANLTLSFANIVATSKPMWFVMENVSTITQSKTLKEAIKIFKSANYGLNQYVLNACYCGVPQERKRFILVGKFGEQDNFLGDIFIESFTKSKMTVRQYLGNKIDTEFYYRHPRSYQRRAIFSIDEPSPTIRGVNRPIPPNYNIHKNDKTKDIRQVRCLTTKERSLIQTFPTNFIWDGKKGDLEQIIGNAVPVKLAEFIASCLKNYV